MVLPDELGCFLLGAIMMLIGVAGTEDRVAADSVMPATNRGYQSFFAHPIPLIHHRKTFYEEH